MNKLQICQRILAVLLVLFLQDSLALGGAPKIPAGIASAHPLATKAGAYVLSQGGNAFDAAIAITATLAVVEPYSSGIGGGGFYMLFEAKSNKTIFLDAREYAPAAATRDMYLDKEGQVKPSLSIDGPLSAGIPGIPAALGYLAKHYGRKKLSFSLAEAIELAEDGFAADAIYVDLANRRHEALHRYPSSRQIFLIDGRTPKQDEKIVQADLGRTLEAIAYHGAQIFYQGSIARNMVEAVRQAGGIWQLSDLEDYRVIEREPLIVDLASGGRLYLAPPPSSGGVALAQIFGQLEALGRLDEVVRSRSIDATEESKALQAENLHYLIEAMRRAYRDRAVYLGDSDFVDIPITRLVNPDYLAGLASNIHSTKASKSAWLPSANNAHPSSEHTTHFSVIDREGNMVSATLSINYAFGSGFVAGNTGVLLNDEMDDFSSKPDTPNVYGLIGGRANQIEPRKRMLSSMSPSILKLGEKTVLIGTPGGSRIITMVALGILEALAHQDAQAIVSAGRFHHQFYPDKVFVEPKVLAQEVLDGLIGLGHDIVPAERTWGNMQVVLNEGDVTTAASDPRGIGEAWTDPQD